jgi:hypothetical protein
MRSLQPAVPEEDMLVFVGKFTMSDVAGTGYRK